MSSNTTQAAERSGAAVFGAARRALDDCPTVPGTVRVHVEDGTVTLTGSVQRPSQRSDAENVVRPTIGRRRLLNKITVAQAPSAEGLELLDERG
jgi:osmotically-inducible protein OsmY